MKAEERKKTNLSNFNGLDVMEMEYKHEKKTIRISKRIRRVLSSVLFNSCRYFLWLFQNIHLRCWNNHGFLRWWWWWRLRRRILIYKKRILRMGMNDRWDVYSFLMLEYVEDFLHNHLYLLNVLAMVSHLREYSYDIVDIERYWVLVRYILSV